MSRKVLTAAAVVALALPGAGCVTNPDTGDRKLSRTAIGAALGAGVGAGFGALVGGRNNRAEVLIGTGIGALAGGLVGRYMDRQEKELREKTAGTGIGVERRGDEIQLSMPSNVTFDVDSAIVSDRSRAALGEVARVLSQYEKTYVDVMGHTDSTGSEAYNLTLSQRRAESVASYLTAHGVQRARIAAQGFGEAQPAASNASESGRASNRRVEIRLAPITAAAS